MTDRHRSGINNINKINIVISIVIAFIAWVFVVYNYSPMKDVTYTNVPITYVGEDALVQKSLGILSSSTDVVDVTLSINRTNYNNISADDIMVAADVTNAVEGSNGVSLNVTAPDGCSLVRMSTSLVEVTVVGGANKDVDLTAVYAHGSDDGTEPLTSNMSYSRVSVLGAAENIAKVRSAVIRLNKDAVGDKAKSFVASPVAVDASGKEVKHVVVLPSEISFQATAGVVKSVKLTLAFRDNSRQNNYKIDAPDKIYIKGTEKALAGVDSVSVEPIDLSGVTENTIFNLTFRLPDGVQLASQSLGCVAKVIF